jgi:riboflavin biosynthesis pyrimidine reductase
MRRLDLDQPGRPSATITAGEAYDVPRPRPATRPWVGLCMVSSLDGSAVVETRSNALSSDADREVLAALRAAADLIIVGAGTVRIERYGPPRKPGQRIGVISHSGDIDLTQPLFTSGAGFLILPEDAPARAVDTVRAGVGELDLAAALTQLDADFVQAEGGPGLNGALAAADLIDELNLTVSPQIVGGNGPRIVTGATAHARPMRLVHVLEQDGFLFSRFVRRED